MDETTIDTIEVNGSDVDVRITWEIEYCECTSEYGNSEVTERWTEAHPVMAETCTNSARKQPATLTRQSYLPSRMK
jgi:hypothetical protein